MNFELVDHCQKANRYLRYLNAIIPPKDLLPLFARWSRNNGEIEIKKGQIYPW